MRGGYRFFNQLRRVGGGNERGFVGRGAEGDAAIQHAVEEGFEAVGIGSGHIGVALREAVGEADPSPCAEKSWKYKQPLMV